MQNGGDAAESSREDRRRCDVAAGGEHHLGAFTFQQAPHPKASRHQPQQLPELAQAAALQAPGLNGDQPETFRHQLCFEAVRHTEPAHLPALIETVRHRQGREQVAAGAAGGDQKPGHGGGRPRWWRLT